MEIEMMSCTGMMARWCPVHGKCTCSVDFETPGCPLHDPGSEHPVRDDGYLQDLVNRLRGVYEVPVNDGASALNGKTTYTSTFDVPPIHREAALAIEVLVDRLDMDRLDGEE